MTTNEIPFPSIPAGHVYPEMKMVVLVKGNRYQIVGFNRTTLNVLGEDGKSYKLSQRGAGTVQPDADQSWTVSLPELRLGQVVQFVNVGAARYPGLYVIIKTASGMANVSKLGGDDAGPGTYIRAPYSEIRVVKGSFQAS